MSVRRLDPERLKLLYTTELLDSPPEEAFDRLTRLATKILHTPVSLVSLVDVDRQFFKSSVGLSEPWSTERETPLSHSFCQYVVERDAPLVVEDAREHELLRDNLAVPDLGVVAYAGMPLRLSTGEVLGSLCAIDSQPREWTAEELEALRDLATAVVTEIELRLALAEIAAATHENVRRALEVNDEVVQALTTAKLALELDRREDAVPSVVAALAAARRFSAGMLDAAAVLEPGALRRLGDATA